LLICSITLVIVNLMRLLIRLNRFQRSDVTYRTDVFKDVLTIWR